MSICSGKRTPQPHIRTYGRDLGVAYRRTLYCVALYVMVVFAATGVMAEASASTVTGTVTIFRFEKARDVLVYLEGAQDTEAAPVSKLAVMDRIKKEFVPRVLPVLRGTEVIFRSSDSILHSAHAFRGRESLFNVLLRVGGVPIRKVFNELGEVVVLCDMHQEMASYIIVLETSYAGVTNSDGRYEIPNVPPGKYTLRTWHEMLTPIVKNIVIRSDEDIKVDLELE